MTRFKIRVLPNDRTAVTEIHFIPKAQARSYFECKYGCVICEMDANRKFDNEALMRWADDGGVA